MRVKFNQSVAGIDFVYGAGEVIDLPTSDANYFIRTGYAEKAVEDEKPPAAKRPLKAEKARAVKTRPVKKKE